jgi:hydroxymethylpyrimidine/phosphomethylpyrimidine kinase
MLYTPRIARVVVDFLKRRPRLPLVVDPVMISTSGARLLAPAAIKFVKQQLLPLATLVTPNVHEAASLVGRQLGTVEDLRYAAREIHRCFGCAALVKGGHLEGLREAADIFYDGKNELLLTAPYITGIHTHGTGCTYSAAIVGNLALGFDLPAAVTRAKEFIANAIAQSRTAAGHPVLNYFWR